MVKSCEACITTELGKVSLTSALNLTGDSLQVDFLVCPEHVQLCNAAHGTQVQVVHTSFRGTHKLHTLCLPSGATLCALFPSRVTLRSGELATSDWADLRIRVVFPRQDTPAIQAD